MKNESSSNRSLNKMSSNLTDVSTSSGYTSARVSGVKIYDTPAQVLPRFFKQTKYLSFTRQLNLWGFKRITRGIDAGAYYHELFLPGRTNLSMRMKRQKIKGTGIS